MTENSQVLLLLLDARCPPLHIPQSLRDYLQGTVPHKEVILVLTKCDLVDEDALGDWKIWLRQWWAEGVSPITGTSQGELRIVCVNNYDSDADQAGKWLLLDP